MKASVLKQDEGSSSCCQKSLPSSGPKPVLSALLNIHMGSALSNTTAPASEKIKGDRFPSAFLHSGLPLVCLSVLPQTHAAMTKPPEKRT